MPSLDTTPQELKELEILMMQSSKLEFCPFPGADFRVKHVKALRREQRRQKNRKKSHKTKPSHRYNQRLPLKTAVQLF